jgi:endonuclease YncB( thermonuclease family)
MRKSQFLILLLSFFVATSSLSSAADSYTGQVIDVADGDTVTVLNQNNESAKIRLTGIDCPESSQIHGNQAKQFTVSKVSGKRVRIFPETTDRYGRTVALVLINGENLNEQIVTSGNGWVYRKYCTADYCNDWLKLEETARDSQVGLWENKNPQAPWEWRAEHRNGKGSWSGDKASTVASSAAAGGGSSIIYHGNRRSSVFHGPSCRDYNCKNCTVTLGSYQEAVGAGFRAHRECVSE